ncbi:MAG: hypothetical protein M1833_002412, partial [Piccolia ochrophora]
MPSSSLFALTSPVALLLTLVVFIAQAFAHSWVEQLTVIAPNGTFVGAPGYPRGNILRSDPGFNDPAMVNLLPPNGRANGIGPTDKLCKSTQAAPNQGNGSPALQAAPGSFVALRYQENGHVTIPESSPGKEENRGWVYIYGTSEPKSDELFNDVHKKWTEDGSGGDKRGRLLAKQPYDDGQCYQVNGKPISTDRVAKYSHAADKDMGMDLWCQNNIALPKDVTTGKPYTLYWVWDWPTLGTGDSGVGGKDEIYTTCMDVDITESKQVNSASAEGYAQQDLSRSAVPGYMKELTGGKSGGSSGDSPSEPSQREPAQSAPSQAPSREAPPGQSPATPPEGPTGSPSSPDQPGQAPPPPGSQQSCTCPPPAALAPPAAPGPAPAAPAPAAPAPAGPPGAQVPAAGGNNAVPQPSVVTVTASAETVTVTATVTASSDTAPSVVVSSAPLVVVSSAPSAIVSSAPSAVISSASLAVISSAPSADSSSAPSASVPTTSSAAVSSPPADQQQPTSSSAPPPPPPPPPASSTAAGTFRIESSASPQFANATAASAAQSSPTTSLPPSGA